MTAKTTIHYVHITWAILYLEYLTHWARDKMAPIFADDIFKCIFLNENMWITIYISLKFVPKCRINSISALVQIRAWHRLGVSYVTYIFISELRASHHNSVRAASMEILSISLYTQVGANNYMHESSLYTQFGQLGNCPTVTHIMMIKQPAHSG